MPKYGLQYMHNGDIYEVQIFADSFDDADARLASTKATGEIDGEIIHEEEAGDDVVARALAGVNALKEQLQ